MSRRDRDRPGLQPTLIAGSAQIASDLRVEGLVSSAEDLVVRGRVKGRLSLGRSLLIETGAHVEADVEAASVVVRGTVRGGIRASERIELASSSDVEGDIEAPILRVEPGARFIGRMLMRFELDPRRFGART